MDLHIPSPSSTSSDGMYDLAELTPTGAAPAADAAPAANGAAPPPRADILGAPAPAAAQNAAVEDQKSAEKEKAAAAAAPKKKKKRKSKRFLIPAWGVSFLVHFFILGSLAAYSFNPEVRKQIANLNSALIATPKGGPEELVHIYADATTATKSDQAVGDENATSEGGGGGTGVGSGIGTGPPSTTPRVGVTSKIGEKSGMPSLKVVPQVSGLSLLPAAPGKDLGGGGMISGDVTYEASDVGVALDQLAREILRHLTQHKVTVVWLFDESQSMKDDQKAIKGKFDRVASELKLNAEGISGKKSASALNHAIVGFGATMHYELEKPTIDIDQIGRAIDRLRIDDSGTENTMHAVQDVVSHYSGMIRKDRKLLVVLVTDESGDDGEYVEEARQALVGRNVPLYVIGRQSLFGYGIAHLQYVDPVTKDVYWPGIHRGPETAGVEQYQWDGLHDRWDEQPSGFAPYELARLSKDSGGIYFLLPSEEYMRVRQREKAYALATSKEYVPDYESRAGYVEKRTKSELRRSLFEIIQLTKAFPYRRHFPINPAEMVDAASKEVPVVTDRLTALLAIQKRLESLQKARDREPEKRWQAHYDLMLAQTVAYQVKAFEYRACLLEMIKKPPRPKTMPTAEMQVEWVIDHSGTPKAPKDLTAKKYAEADRLLKQVIARHPKTPWSDLAQDEINRGFSAQINEWHHNPRYNERAKLVPHY